MMPKLPTTPGEINFQDQWTQTLAHERFLLCDDRDEAGNRILVQKALYSIVFCVLLFSYNVDWKYSIYNYWNHIKLKKITYDPYFHIFQGLFQVN